MSWTKAAPGDKLAVLVGLFIGVAGIAVAFAGSWLAWEQGNLAEKQEAYFEEQRAKLPVLAINLYQSDEANIILVGVKNSGSASARDFHWVLLTPGGWDSSIEVLPLEYPVSKPERVLLDGMTGNAYTVRRGFVAAPTYPGRVTLLMKLQVEPGLLTAEYDTISDNRFRWFINAEAGRFPLGQVYGVTDFLSPTGVGPQVLTIEERQ